MPDPLKLHNKLPFDTIGLVELTMRFMRWVPLDLPVFPMIRHWQCQGHQ